MKLDFFPTMMAGSAATRHTPDRPFYELLALGRQRGPLSVDLSTADHTIVTTLRVSYARIDAEKAAQGR